MNTAPRTVSDEVFAESWCRLQSAVLVARELGLQERGVHKRRRNYEAKHGKILKASSPNSPSFYMREHQARADCTLQDGCIVVGSDVHKWPGANTVAQDAFLKVVKKIKPELVVLNGDVFDGAGISRWPKTGYGHPTPSVKDELEAVADFLAEVERASPGSKRWWTIGNHDMRFESRLANIAPEYEGVAGFSLQEQFPLWPMSISLMVNQNLMIKHRYHNGIHATYNKALKSGVSIVTGQLHRLQATVFTDYNGTRWGVDTGTLGETTGEAVAYGEDNPANHCAGFAVLTIVDGRMIHPEFCAVQGDQAFFRGKEIK